MKANFFKKAYQFLKARYAPRGARQFFSASGEDIIMSDLLKKAGIDKPTYIDIGAHHPIFGNNTYLFYLNGSRGVLVEPNTDLWKLAKEKRPKDTCINAGVGKEDGKADFFNFPMKSTRSSFSQAQAKAWQDISGEEPVVESKEIFSLDTIINKYLSGSPPDIVSIDAEGLDKDILSGFSWRVKPKIFCIEMSPGIDMIMAEHGYERVAGIFQNSIFIDKV